MKFFLRSRIGTVASGTPLALLCGGQLALAEACHAAIMFFPQIPPNEHLWTGPGGLGEGDEPIDINSDGITDLTMLQGFGFGVDLAGRTAVLGRQSFSAPVDPSGRSIIVHASVAGEVIGPDADIPTDFGIFWRNDPQFINQSTYRLAWGVPSNINSYGGEFFITRRFLGLRLEQEPGVFHYGWLDIQNNRANPWNYVIHGWAWETNPDTPIAAGAIPEPSAVSIALLASLGFFVRRRVASPG